MGLEEQTFLRIFSSCLATRVSPMTGCLPKYSQSVIVRPLFPPSKLPCSREFCLDGGAGTTAIGLLLGKPTIVVPFFGDQPFWGRMIHNAGAGPKPIPQKKLTSERLAEGIKFCTTEGAKAAAAELGGRIKAEVCHSFKCCTYSDLTHFAMNQDGRQKGVDSFHAHLPLLNMRWRRRYAF